MIEAEDYFFACSRYIELNPVRAGLAETPGAYRWSSYKANALGAADPVVTPHELYAAHGESPATRAEAYSALFEGAISEPALGAIREAVNGGWPLGWDSFVALVSRHARPAAPAPQTRQAHG